MVAAAGELSVWEFSGFEPYYVVYDHYIGDPNCINVIVFSLADTTERQLAQVEFWMDFIRLRMPSSGPICESLRVNIQEVMLEFYLLVPKDVFQLLE